MIMKTVVEFGSNIDLLAEELKRQGIRSARLHTFKHEPYPHELSFGRGNDFGVLVTAIGERDGQQMLYRALAHVGNVAAETVGPDVIRPLVEKVDEIATSWRARLGTNITLDAGWFVLA